MTTETTPKKTDSQPRESTSQNKPVKKSTWAEVLAWLSITASDIFRLVITILLIGAGWAIVTIIVSIDSPDHENFVKNNWEGLTPAIRACYAYGSKTSPLVISYAVGLLLGVLYVFGSFLYKKFWETSSSARESFFCALAAAVGTNTKAEIVEVLAEYREYEKTILDRRNIFWGLYTRVSLAIVVIGLISLLISTCKIESQAGLPIISGIIAFIIGQGADAFHSSGPPTFHVRMKDNENRNGGDRSTGLEG